MLQAMPGAIPALCSQIARREMARGVNRIDEICDRLKEIWKRVPDWRLTQMFCNVQRATDNDLFYVEDEPLIKLLDELIPDIGKE